MIDILYYIFILIAGFAFAIVGIAVLILTPYVAYKRLTAPMPLKKEPIDLNFQPTPELQQAYEDEDWDAYDTLMGEYVQRPPERSPFESGQLESISA